jgi:hypothetical protein
MALMFDVILRVGLLIATGFLFGIILLAYLRFVASNYCYLQSGSGYFSYMLSSTCLN